MGKSITEIMNEMYGRKIAVTPGGTEGVVAPKTKLPVPDTVQHLNDPVVRMFLEQRGLLEAEKKKAEDDKKKKPPVAKDGCANTAPSADKETDDEQDKIKLGVKTPVDTEPSTDDITVSDVEGSTKPPKKNAFKKMVKTEGFLGSLGNAAKTAGGIAGGAATATLAVGGVSPTVGKSVADIISGKIEKKKKEGVAKQKANVDDNKTKAYTPAGAKPGDAPNPMGVNAGTKKPGAKRASGVLKPPAQQYSKVDAKDLMDEFHLDFNAALQEIFSGFHAGPPKIAIDDWKGSYDAAIQHHNAGIDAHNKGDKALARMHFRTRDKYMIRYARSAPKDDIAKHNMDKVKKVLDIHERAVNPQIKYGGPWRDSVNKISAMNLDVGTMQVKRLSATGKNRTHLEKQIKKAKFLRDKAIENHKNTFPIKFSEDTTHRVRASIKAITLGMTNNNR